jgi:prepilin-type N-terminal cleavage/methylation domain-containing protein
MNPGRSPGERRSPGECTLQRRGGGFTLIEMLVVLIIVAMISAIVVTSYQRILDIRVRLAAFLDGVDAPTMIAGWFRGSVEGLIADQKGGGDVFAGAPRRFAGLSVAAIDGTAGVPTRIAWELTFDPVTSRTALNYRRDDRAAMMVASWPGDRGQLRYCDPRLVCSESWPPTDRLGSQQPASRTASQLPSLIILDAVRGTEAWPIVAAPQADRDPRPKSPNVGRPSS